MSLTQKELEEYWVKRERGDELQKMTLTHCCSECGNPLITPYDREKKEVILCCGTDRNHKGFTRLKGYRQSWREGQAIPLIIANKIEQKERREARQKYAGKEVR